MALWLLLCMASLLTVLAGILFSAVYRERAGLSYAQGLAAQYAAESGAVWALEELRRERPPARKEWTLSFDGTRCRVVMEPAAGGGEEARWKGRIRVRGEHTGSGTARYLQLQVTAGAEEPVLSVTEVGREKW